MALIALLPMKGHSERVPGKNIRVFHGKPLFFHIGDTLRDSRVFERLIINTDSDEIASLATQRYGSWVSILERPEQLRGDHVSMNEIIAHDLTQLGLEHDYFQTHSTNPLLRVETLKLAVGLYCQGKENSLHDSVFSVNGLRSRLYSRDMKPLNHDPERLVRTQDLDIIYEENSCFYIFSGAGFVHSNHRIGQRPLPYVMQRDLYESIDIDEPADWNFAERIMQLGYGHV